jgi:cyclophilin family peptidyl-prolyl cis-trans isomerase
MKKLILLLPLLMLMSFKGKEKRQTIEISTSYGVMKVMLYNETPITRDSIIKLVKKHFYDSLLFHRCIKNFMIQGGDPDSKHAVPGAMLGNGDVGTIPAEFRPNIYHKKGAIAMAREGDDVNPQKASSGCQFYIVEGKTYTDDELNQLESKLGIKFTEEERTEYKTVGGTPFLDQNYTVFGEVYEGMNVIDSIADVKTDQNDRPLTDIRMTVKLGKKIKVKH